MKLLFLGTSSDAGKTTVSALFCRYLTKNGFDAVPFKASNLSCNFIHTSDGGDIGIGQALQAKACGKEPSGKMNPILLRPSNRGSIRYIINGSYYGEISPGCSPDVDELASTAYTAYDELAAEHEAVICEGSGSPVELNRMDRDFSNIRLMREKNIPAVIVGDIERGGVFAAIYGTWLLINEADRKNLKGFIINRFRGDPSLLTDGVRKIEKITGMVCLGIVPYIDINLPKEDTLTSSAGMISDPRITDEHLNNLDMMLDIAKDSLDFHKMVCISSE